MYTSPFGPDGTEADDQPEPVEPGGFGGNVCRVASEAAPGPGRSRNSLRPRITSTTYEPAATFRNTKDPSWPTIVVAASLPRPSSSSPAGSSRSVRLASASEDPCTLPATRAAATGSSRMSTPSRSWAYSSSTNVASATAVAEGWNMIGYVAGRPSIEGGGTGKLPRTRRVPATRSSADSTGTSRVAATGSLIPAIAAADIVA